MKFSKAWLQTYSKEPLPDTKTLENLITLNAFEIEEISQVEGDDIFDIKILPNRAHDALSHRGVARDICALLGTTFFDPEEYYDNQQDTSISPPAVIVEDSTMCTRFMSVRIDGISVTQSPEWLKKKLESIGQKSINSIVDITNYVQFAINKPMHAYDAHLVEGETLIARLAKEGETLITLDDKELLLDKSTLVIADTVKPLGLAGIKGGKFSGISGSTTSVILESANFNQSLIRKTSQRYNIRTDASKRFESELSDSLVEEGIRMTIALIKKLNPQAQVSPIVDVCGKLSLPKPVTFSLENVNKYLGTSYSQEEVISIMKALQFTTTLDGENITVIPPPERLDISIKEDVIEEIVRSMGLSSVPSVLPKINRKGLPHKRIFYENKIRSILYNHDFSDVMTYSFGSKGEIRIKKGLASDKEYLRSSLGDGLLQAFSLNKENAPLLKVELIKLYEFGNVFDASEEKRQVAILIDDGKKKSSYSEDVEYILSEIKRELDVDLLDYTVISSKPYCVVVDFDSLISTLPDPIEYEPLPEHTLTTSYKVVSSYPFIVRDIAVFTPTSVMFDNILSVITPHLSSLVISCDLFDTFTKTFEDGTQKISYAFRLVLQSYEKTLTDFEANEVADKVYGALKEKGWEVR